MSKICLFEENFAEREMVNNFNDQNQGSLVKYLIYFM